jgi:hypothetical protein
MTEIRSPLLFVLKSIVFSTIFICIVFATYTLTYYDSHRRNTSDKSESANVEEYNRQLNESAKMMERQKEFFKRAEANLAEQERNAKRMSAILDMWEAQAKRAR